MSGPTRFPGRRCQAIRPAAIQIASVATCASFSAAAGILIGRGYARSIGWTAAVSAVLMLAGNLLELVIDAAFVAVLAGFVLFLGTQIALGVSMWRSAREPRLRPPREPATVAVATGETWSTRRPQ